MKALILLPITLVLLCGCLASGATPEPDSGPTDAGSIISIDGGQVGDAGVKEECLCGRSCSFSADGVLDILGTCSVSNQEQINWLATFSDVRLGDGLDVFGDYEVGTIALSSITRIDGSLYIGDFSKPTSLQIATEHIGGNIEVIGGEGLLEVLLPQVAEIGGTINILNAPDLTLFSMPVLTDVIRTLQFGANPSLENVDVRSLVRVGQSFSFINCPSLSEVDASSLTTVLGSVTFEGNSSLSECDIEDLVNTLSISGSTIVEENGPCI